jgi:outer membrane protein insertion porin family
LHKYLLYCLVVFSGLSLFSCKNSLPTPNNKHILWRNQFKGNVKIHSDELQALIPFSQRENSKPLNLPLTPRVWWYNFGLSRFDSVKTEKKLKYQKDKLTALKQNESYSLRRSNKIERKIDRYETTLEEKIGWFYNNIGEKQVYISEEEAKETANKIQKVIFDMGYRDAEVKEELVLNKSKAIVRYNVFENQLYTIDTVEYVVNDLTIDSLLLASKPSALIKSGEALNYQKVELEKLRLEHLLKNNGYYGFNNRFISYGVTNNEESEELFKQRKKGNLRIEVLNPEGGYHNRYTLSEISFKTFDARYTGASTIPDTTILQNVKFIHQDKSVPLNPIRKRIITKEGEFYSNKKIFDTQRQISLFNQFSFATSQIKVLDSSRLALEYYAPTQERFTFGISPGINNIYTDGNSFFGFGIPVSLSMRNAFRRLEIVELGVRASYEGQPTPIRTSEAAIRGSLELGGNLNITLPNMLPFNPFGDKINLKNPRTTLGIGYNYSEPFWGTRTNFKLTAGNSVQLNRNAILYFNFLDAYLINTSYANNASGREFYRTLDSLQRMGNNLKVTFDPQFVSSINANYVFNNQDPSKPFSNSSFFRLFVESAGTVLNFTNEKDKLGFVENLFPMSAGPDSVRAYFRFFKINADYRKSINLTPKSSYAFRVNLGVANPYGSNKAIPYDKSFFVGGSNSIRAWAPRSLGTGSSVSDTTAIGNVIPQPGDILLEGSLEYRVNVLRFAGNIQLAAFIDAGNVWKWHPINLPQKINKSNFEMGRFYKEIAVGTGFGVRWDLNFFLFRFDWGIKVVDPSRAVGDRYVLDKFSLKRNQQYGLNLNFGIGYPF